MVKIKAYIVTFVLTISLALQGCVVNTTDLDNSAPDYVKARIHINKTTRKNVRAALSFAPALRAKTMDGLDVDVYVYNEFDAAMTNYIPFYPNTKNIITEKILTLVYNKDQSVRSYRLSGMFFIQNISLLNGIVYTHLHPLTQKELSLKRGLTEHEGVTGFYRYMVYKRGVDEDSLDTDALDDMTFKVPSVNIRAQMTAEKFLGPLHNIELTDFEPFATF